MQASSASRTKRRGSSGWRTGHRGLRCASALVALLFREIRVFPFGPGAIAAAAQRLVRVEGNRLRAADAASAGALLTRPQGRISSTGDGWRWTLRAAELVL